VITGASDATLGVSAGRLCWLVTGFELLTAGGVGSWPAQTGIAARLPPAFSSASVFEVYWVSRDLISLSFCFDEMEVPSEIQAPYFAQPIVHCSSNFKVQEQKTP
jgi:hypothetical protein